jgi:hypothetical protein
MLKSPNDPVMAVQNDAAPSTDPLPAQSPAGSQVRRGHGLLKACLTAALLACIVVAVAISWAVYRTGSIRAGLAYLAGQEIYASPRSLAVPGEGDVQSVTLSNLSGDPIQIIGYNAQCSCVELPELPVALAPWETRKLAIRAVSEVTLDVPVVLITDRAETTLRIDVKVVASQDCCGAPPDATAGLGKGGTAGMLN